MSSRWLARRSDMESARPRVIATSGRLRSRDSCGSRARWPDRPGCSDPKVTCSSGASATVFMVSARARLKGPAGPSLSAATVSSYRSGERDIGGGLRQLLAEATVIELGNEAALELVALVEEGDAETEGEIAEDLGILGPGDDGARAHDGREVAIDEGIAGEIGDPDHVGDGLAALVGLVALDLGQHDLAFAGMRQIIEGHDDRP